MNARNKTMMPTSHKKLTIQDAARALAAIGYTLGKASTDLRRNVTSYEVSRDGKTAVLTTSELKNLIRGN